MGSLSLGSARSFDACTTVHGTRGWGSRVWGRRLRLLRVLSLIVNCHEHLALMNG